MRVEVSNHIQYQPIIAYYQEPFIVQQPITPGSLFLGVDGSWNGAPPYELVRFYAHCDGSHVTYYFNFGDGTGDVMSMDGSAYHNFTQGRVICWKYLLICPYMQYA